MKVTHISLWPPDDDEERVKLNQGVVNDKRDYVRLEVSDGLARSRGLDPDVCGWRIFASRLADGEFEHVYDGTVTSVDRVSGMAGMRRVFRCEPGGVGQW